MDLFHSADAKASSRPVPTFSAPLRSFSAPSPQLAVSWAPLQRLLYSGGVDGSLYAWDPTTMEEVHSMRPPPPSSRFSGHLSSPGSGAFAFGSSPNTRRVIKPGFSSGRTPAFGSLVVGAPASVDLSSSTIPHGRRMSHLLAASTVKTLNMEVGLGIRPGVPPKRHVSQYGESNLHVASHRVGFASPNFLFLCQAPQPRHVSS